MLIFVPEKTYLKNRTERDRYIKGCESKTLTDNVDKTEVINWCRFATLPSNYSLTNFFNQKDI